MRLCKTCGMMYTDGLECPSCGSVWTGEAEDCAICGHTHIASEMVNGVCKDCLKESATVRTAIGVGEKFTDVIEVNSFFVYHLGEDRINELILNAIVNAEPKHLKRDAEVFCMDDLDCLSEFLVEIQGNPDEIKRYSKLRRKNSKGVKE